MINIFSHIQFASKKFWISCAVLLLITYGWAYSQTADISNITLKDVSTQKTVSFSDYSKNKSIVIIFFCNDCPYSIFYIDRIKNFASSFTDHQFFLINSSNSEFVPEESETNMTAFVKDKGVNIPYLSDKNRDVLKVLKASRCPEVFVLTPRDWKVVYKGAIDNNPQVAGDVSDFYLRNALQAIDQGRAITTAFERPVGCVIK